MQIKGILFDGKSAKDHRAVMHVDGDAIRLTDNGGHPLCTDKDLLSSIDIIPKLGGTRRLIRFKGGQQFETEDWKAVEALETLLGVNRSFKIVSFLEARWPAVIICLVGLITFVWVSVVFGLPKAARVVAFKIPHQAMNSISQDALTMLDKRFFKASELSESRKAQIRSVFFTVIRETGKGHGFSLEFRKSEALGANAFALPSGTIIVTDALVEASDDIRQIQGILIHEISHVTHRHSLRSVIQNTGVVVLISLLAGDVTSVTSLAASIPTLLLESGYSRQFEIEADEAVGLYFLSKGWPVKAYEDILLRITKDKSQSDSQSDSQYD